jgi:hypothetical protein
LTSTSLRKAAGLDSISEAVTAYERHLKPVIEHQEWLERLQRQALGGLSMQDFARQLEQTNPALSAIEAAKRSLDNMLGTFRDIDFSELELDEEDKHEAELVVQAITQAATAEPTLQAAVDQFIEVIREQRNPVVQLMLWSLFPTNPLFVFLLFLLRFYWSKTFTVFTSSSRAPPLR